MRTSIIAAALIIAAVLPAEARGRKADDRLLIPTRASLEAQNAAIRGMEMPADDKALAEMVRDGDLVRVTTALTLTVDPRVPDRRRYLRPAAYGFALRLAVEFYSRYRVPLQVNSAVRTVRDQRRLRRWNCNAAPWRGAVVSPHMAGAAFDLQRRWLTREQLRFLQWRLFYYQAVGLVIAGEERRHPCFHVAVIERTAPKPDNSGACEWKCCAP